MAVVTLLFAAPARACDLPPAVTRVLDEMTVLIARGADAPGPDLADLVGMLDAVEIEAAMTRGGLDPLIMPVSELLSAANRLVSRGRIGNTDALSADLDALDRDLALLCARRLGADPGGRTLFQPTVYMHPLQASVPGLQRVRDSPPLQAAALISGMLAGIGLLYLVRLAMQVLLAVVYNRRMCRIPAALEVGGARFDGLVITLGRGGFRFVPLDPGEHMRIADAVERHQPRLCVGDRRWRAQLSLLMRGAADFRFAERRLRLSEQRALL